jgi:hypothetical protein
MCPLLQGGTGNNCRNFFHSIAIIVRPEKCSCRETDASLLYPSLYGYRIYNRKAIVLMISTLWYNLKGGERKMFDWNLFLNIIIAILQAIAHALPV